MVRGEAYQRLEREIQKEKAEALGRLGERLALLLARLGELGRRIDELERALAAGAGKPRPLEVRLEEEIERFNRLREEAVRLVHDLVIQREAVGFRRHVLLASSYPIPPRRSLPSIPVSPA